MRTQCTFCGQHFAHEEQHLAHEVQHFAHEVQHSTSLIFGMSQCKAADGDEAAAFISGAAMLLPVQSCSGLCHRALVCHC